MHRLLKILRGETNGLLASLLRGLLWLASFPYALAMRLRNLAYDRGWKNSWKAPCPVISVGNLTAGGTGKTPTVAMLAHWFRDQGIRVAIVSRGYRAGEDGRNDEAREWENRLPDVPHVQHADRRVGIRICREELDCQLILLDDAFQHRQVARDLEIVLIDSLDPFGGGYLLPRGLLREGLRSLRRADVIVATRTDLVSASRLAEIRTTILRWAPKAAWVESAHAPIGIRNASGQTLPLHHLDHQRWLPFCGLGNPEGFLQTLKQLPIGLAEPRWFADHHHYTADDLQSLIHQAKPKDPNQPPVDGFLCTGKDLPKIGVDSLGGLPLWAVEIELAVRSGWEGLEDRLQPLAKAALEIDPHDPPALEDD
ncbi:MAG: tetraacyldisaccharide 4'-kinase [Pirellulaceae bacterium]